MVQNYAKRCSDNTKDPDQNRDQQRTFSLSDTVHLWAGDEETPETQTDRHAFISQGTFLCLRTL